jgi:hypothetical protein
MDDDYLGTLLDMFEITEPEIGRTPLESALKISPLPSDNPGQAFLDWVKEGIQSHNLIINDSKAKVHTVDGTLLLVTPGIFQRYAQEFPGIASGANAGSEEWCWIQKRFEQLNLHRKQKSGLNIWCCQVKGPRRKTTLKGYLLTKPELVISPLPVNNPFLTIKTEEEL